MSDALPPEAMAADADGVPEHTMNAFTGPGGPEGHIEDADQGKTALPDGSETLGTGVADLDASQRFAPDATDAFIVVGLDLDLDPEV